MEILIDGNFIKAREEISEGFYQKFYDNVTTIHTVQVKLVADMDNYCKHFFTRD